ncbi:MAG: hypothetical protein ACE5E1_04075 [Phycisphaerae bacterium]
MNENIGAQRGNPDSLSLSGRVGYAERPTITYSPLKGDDFVKRMLAPIGIEHVVLLTQSGWKVDRVLRLTLQGMNGLDNASAASGPTPAVAPPFRRFLEAAALLGRLKRDARVRFEYQTRVAEVSDLLPAKLITADALVEANKAGARFRETDNGRAYVLTRDQRQLVLRVAADAVASPETARLRQLLRLAPDRSQYPLIPAAAGGASPGGPEVPRERLAWDCRSRLGVMFYLSQGVRVPAAHLRSGIVTDTRDADGGPFDWSSVLGDLFDVHVRRLPPTDAAVAIRHRGYWFYIRDDDLTTKSTFALLDQLFTLQAGSAKSAAPILTLPVGG